MAKARTASKSTAKRKTPAVAVARMTSRATAIKPAAGSNGNGRSGGKRQKMVYYFGGGRADGDGKMKPLLGGKGANLAEMTRIGLPVPPGFTITTEVCTAYYQNGKKLPPGLMEEVQANISKLERELGKKFSDPRNPLLVAVRSGARDSMPGMMDTILNLGLNDTTVEALKNATQNGRFAWDCYRRFVQM